jgi:hypothetical protein
MIKEKKREKEFKNCVNSTVGKINQTNSTIDE